MIWWAVIYWLVINTVGVGVIVGSMCPIEKKTDASSVKKDTSNNKEYPPDYFKNMAEANEANAMNKILRDMSDYFAKETSTSMYLINWDTYKKVPFSLLSETFNKYGMKMLNLCYTEFTHKDYCNRYTLRVRIIDKETTNTGVTYMKG